MRVAGEDVAVHLAERTFGSRLGDGEEALKDDLGRRVSLQRAVTIEEDAELTTERDCSGTAYRRILTLGGRQAAGSVVLRNRAHLAKKPRLSFVAQQSNPGPPPQDVIACRWTSCSR